MDKSDYILLETLCRKYGTDVVMERLHIPNELRRPLLKGAIGTGIALSTLGAFQANKEKIDPTLNTPIERVIPIEEQIPHYDELVNAVATFLKWSPKNIKVDPSQVQLDPENIVKQCWIHKYDLPGLLAVTHNESHCGVTPRAIRTNSAFSVGCYDNGKDNIPSSIHTQDDSVENYIITMKNCYLQGRSLQDAMRDGQLKRIDTGKRYASDPNYEENFRRTRASMMSKPEYQIFRVLDFYDDVVDDNS